MTLLRTALIPALLFAAVAACSDGGDTEPSAGPLSLEDYFSDVEGIFETASDETEALNDQLENDLSAAGTIEEEIEAVNAFLAGALQISEQTIAEMEAISPPVEVEQPHNDFIEAASEIRDTTVSANEELTRAESAEDVDAALDEFETDSAEAQFAADEACADLQDISDDNGLGANLHCAEPVFPDRPQGQS